MACQCKPTVHPLELFVKLYSQSLPLRVRVETGFYGNDQRSVISSGDIYDFHFIRKERVMFIQDANGTQFSIPFNSAISFGILYNPFSDQINAVKHYSFTSVGEIITCKFPPHIIRATREFISKNPKNSVKKEEILIVKKICQIGKKKKQHLKVHSLLTGEEKSLYRECEGHFLSDPGSVRLYLPEIAEFFGKSLPLDAKMFLNCDVTDDSLSHLVSDVVTMTYVGMESSVVATSCWVDDQNSLSEIKDDDGQCLPVAIPTDLSIDVSVIESQPAKSEELYHTTRKLFENFQSAMIKNMKQATYPSDPVQMLQHKLNQSIREGYERQGVTIEKPTKVYKNSRKTPMHREDSKTRMLEFKLPTHSEGAQRMHIERLPSISYSTFVSDQRMASPKPKPEGKEAGVKEVLSGSSSNPFEYSSSSNNSENIVIQTNAAFEQEVLDSPQEMLSFGWKEGGSLLRDIHLPRDVESDRQSTTYSNQSSSGYDNYDVPRKLAPQSTSTTYTTDVGGAFTEYCVSSTSTSDIMDIVSSTPEAAPHAVSYQSTARDIRVCSEATQNVNKNAISLQELTCFHAPVGSESTACVYDVPPSHIIPSHSLEIHSQSASLACNHSMSTTSCDINTSRLSLTKPLDTSSPLMNITPSVEWMENKCSHNTKQPPVNLSLSELLKNHPLMKVAGSFSSDSISSRLPHLPGSNNQENFVTCPSLNKPTHTLTTFTSPVDMTVKSSSNSIRQKMQSEHVEAKINTSSSSGTDKSQSPMKPISPPKQSSPICSLQEGESVEYSQVVHASMNRAQTLKARNIQELKKLDCQKVQILLENLKLGQYKQSFLVEQIDGEILAECDEEILFYELNVSSEMHRIQLMNIITGKQSVALILSGQNTCKSNYVRLSMH